jgi:asparagine synthase (glutamine-hydrolysing)
MCGIAGIFYFKRERRADAALLERMTSLLSHRGPDDCGHQILGNVALGHRRLSIIDVSAAGHQPMANDDRSIWIAYNGECYNYRELASSMRQRGHRFRSNSDTEVILRLYEEFGEACFKQIAGMFALAIWDGRRKRLILARDRIGIKPLYYRFDRERLLFASEMKSLLVDDETPAIDVAALSDYLHLLTIQDPHCIFRGVHKVEAGQYLTVDQSGVRTTSYWSLSVAIDQNMSHEEAVEGFDARFHDAVASHMVADVPVGAFLSGGLDSSSIVSVAGRASDFPIRTFSITFPGLDEFDESAYAESVARHCGAKHFAFNLTPDLVEALPRIAWHADEPFAVSSAFALYFIAKVAREHVKVVLSGDGGDEVFAGYVWRHTDFAELPQVAENSLPRARSLLRRNPWLRKILPARIWNQLHGWRSKDERYVQAFCCYLDNELLELLEPPLGSRVVEAWEHNAVQKCLEGAGTGEQLAAKLYADMKTTLVSEMLTKADRMTMAHGLEARVPFLDHRLVEWAFTVPGRHKMHPGSGKVLVKAAMERYLPKDILYRRKQGFNVPMKIWMRRELREFVRDNLTPARIARRGIFRPEAVNAVLDDHFAERSDASNKIFVLLMLELWQQLFVDAGRTHSKVGAAA